MDRRFPTLMLLLRIITLCTMLVPGSVLGDTFVTQPWGYRLGATHPPRQGNFCDDRASALEIAGLFERFGPRTGFSALASSNDCSTRVHGVTPRSLLHRVRVPLDGGGEYFISFIEVQADDGTEPVLITTRRLIED